MKHSYTGKTLFVPRYCVDEVEKLIAKRRKQNLIDGLNHIYRRKDAVAIMKPVIDATTENGITLDDCEAMIIRGMKVIPSQSREVQRINGGTGIAYREDYLGIYKWYIGGEK